MHKRFLGLCRNCLVGSCIVIITIFSVISGSAKTLGARASSTLDEPAPYSVDTIKISDTSGLNQTNRPVTVARAFREGEIANFAEASINGKQLLTQCDVKNRWPDGSLKYAIVSFILPSQRAHGSVIVSFSNQVTGNNSNPLTQADMLDPSFDFEAKIEMKGAMSQEIRARQMLADGFYRYWLRGPIVTAVIIEDRTPARAYDRDFGDGSKALHPIFEAWFYPDLKRVRVGFTVENIWASTDASKSMRDLSYGLVLSTGLSSSMVRFSEPSFVHIGRTRWHKTYWVGTKPPTLSVDHNFPYWTSTHVIPNWDTSIRVSRSLLESRSGLDSETAPIEGSFGGIGGYAKDLNQPGANDWIGLAPLWDILYLYSMDARSLRASIANADLAGRIPWDFREADVSAGTGHFFDPNGKVGTFGRIISVNARKRVTLSDLGETCSDGIGADKINTGPISDEGWVTTRDHMPDVAYIPYLFSGEYYYLEALQMQAAFIIAWKQGCTEQSYNRQGDEGFLHDTQLRGDAWGFRTLAYAAFISPDGSPEKSYFEEKLLNNVAEWEGSHDVRLDISGREKEWNFGHSRSRDPRGISPLGSWRDRGKEFVQPPIKPTAMSAASPWEENFLITVLGIARQFGYPTSALLRFGSKRLIEQILNPDTYPQYIEAYRYPTVGSDGRWISTWKEYNNYYSYIPAKGQWSTNDVMDHSYGFIALSALSQLVDFSVDGYSGRAAWQYLRAHKPGQERFGTESPKWAILPVDELAIHPDAQEAQPRDSIEDTQTVESSVTAQEQSDFGSVGWHEIPNTRLRTVCPPNMPEYSFSSNCSNIMAAWSGAIADTVRNRLIIWGGGHNDYYGNEIYALDLDSLTISRLNDPSPLDPGRNCVSTLPDGKPNIRHTYGGLSYIKDADRMYVFGGIVACTSGGGDNDTWTLDLGTLQWKRMDPHKGSVPRTINGVILSDYDPVSKLVFMENTRDFYSYNFDTNTYSTLQLNAPEVSYHMSAIIDPVRRLFVMFGGQFDGTGGVKVISIARHSYQIQDWNSVVRGCDGLRNIGYPGLAYDPVQNIIIGWAGGDSVYLFNPDSRSCASLTYPNGPGPQHGNGTHGRFRYFPKLDAFVLANDVDQDAFMLRLRPKQVLQQ